MATTGDVLALIEKLTGQSCPLNRAVPQFAADLIADVSRGLGHGQFNELLLSLGYDRISHGFFQFLVDGSTKYDYRTGAAIHSIEQLSHGVDRFRKLGMVLYGNVKFAFKKLSSNSEFLRNALSVMEARPEESYRARHDPIHPITKIPSDKTYFLGYVVDGEIQKRLKANPDDGAAIQDKRTREGVVEVARKNYESYLVSDHLDVYVATSMRERHEYQSVHELTEEIFGQAHLKDLKFRYFDPTQAHCKDRLDKGLAEALMLKRAKCTLYFVGESDTLGKDSELASTLAQGKPVVAYVPDPPSDYAEKLLDKLVATYADKSRQAILLEQLRLFDPKAAWNDSEVRKWVDDPSKIDTALATKRLQIAIQCHYDSRALTLRDVHPLGIQVNLSNGVANGVLVVRHVHECAELVKRVVLRTLEFEVEEHNIQGNSYLHLRETISRCVFRVVTGDKMLMNSFWNFYLANPVE
jgi:hypothetical protein